MIIERSGQRITIIQPTREIAEAKVILEGLKEHHPWSRYEGECKSENPGHLYHCIDYRTEPAAKAAERWINQNING